MLGFDALGKLALGQLPKVATETPQALVFSKFSEPFFVKKVLPNQYTEPRFRILRPGAATPGPLVFTKFSEPRFDKVRQQSSTNSSFFVQPAVTAVIVGGDFSDFDLIQSKKNIQTGFSGFVFVPPVVVQPYVFSRFEQPQLRKSIQDFDFDDFYRSSVSIPVQFSDFEQPVFKRVLQQDQSFVNLPTVQVVFQPYVFGQFDQPLVRRIQQADSSFVNLPVIVTTVQPYVFGEFDQPVSRKTVRDQPGFITVTAPVVPVVNFTGFVDSLPQQKRFLEGFITSVQPRVVQNYVFTSFSQPQTKKQLNDQFTWSISTLVSQPYVFSSFSQPFGVRSQEYLHQLTQSVLYPSIIIPIPNFTGFNDFGLAQQTLGSQNKQDGGYSQFTILPMPQIISVVNFTGFSDFNQSRVTSKSYQAALQSQVDFFIFVPVITPVDIVRGGGRWLGEKRYKQHDSSNIDKSAYSEESKQLRVIFKNGQIYDYDNIENSKVKRFHKAKSSGRFLYKNIQGKHPTTKVR